MPPDTPTLHPLNALTMNDATPFHKRVNTMSAVILVELLQCQKPLKLACNGTVQHPSRSETYEKGPQYNETSI